MISLVFNPKLLIFYDEPGHSMRWMESLRPVLQDRVGTRNSWPWHDVFQCQTVSLAPGPKQNHREEAEVTKMKWHEKNETNVYLWFICSWTSAMCQESVSAQLWWFTRWFPEGFVHITTSLMVRTPHWGSRKWTGEGVPHEQDVLSSAQIISTYFHTESPPISTLSPQFFSILLNSSHEDLLKILTSLHRS
jgi:hypothetical protein